MSKIIVTSTKNVHFPKLNWGIKKGDERELPDGKEAQDAILASPYISVVEGRASSRTKQAEATEESLT